MIEGEFKKRSKSGEQIYEHIDGCWDRHCRSCYNMHEDEVPAYEKDLKECNEERWISEKVLDEAIKEFPLNIHNGMMIVDTREAQSTLKFDEIGKWFLKYLGEKK